MSYQIKQSTTAYPLMFFIAQTADHITGLTGASPTVTLSKAGGSFASPSGAVTEVANGWYKVAGNATDSATLGPLVLHATATSGDPTDTVYEVVAYDPQDSVRLGLTGIANAAAGASGGLLINGSNSGTVTLAALTITGTTTHTGTTVHTGAVTMAAGLAITQSTSNTAALVVTGNGTGNGATFTSGSGATGNGLQATAASTNGNGLSATGTGTGHGALLTGGGTGGVSLNAVTVTAAITGNITGNLSGSVGSVTGAVGSVTGAVGSVTGNVGGNVTGSVGSVTGDIGGLAAGAVTDVEDAVWDATLASHLDAGSTGEALNAAGAAGDPWTTALPGAYTIGQAGYLLGSLLAPTTAGTAQSVTGTTIVLAASAGYANDELIGQTVYIVSATTGAGQSRLITDYVGSTDTATVDTWTTTPTGTIVYAVYQTPPSSATSPAVANLTQILGTAVSTPATAGILDVNVKNIDNDAASASGTVTFPNATLASTTNITGGTMTTTTNLTNAPTSGDFTATMKTSIGTAVAASAVASVTGNVGGNVTGTIGGLAAAAVTDVEDAVWDATLASHLDAGSTGEALNAAGAAGDPWVTALPGAYGAGSAGYIIGTNIDALITSRMATYTQPTGFLAATFPGTVASTTNITGGTITTVTNLTNAPTSGDFTATMKTSIGTAVAASAVASVTGAVGSVTGNVGGNVTGSVGSISGITFPTNFSAFSLTAAGRVDLGAINGTTVIGNGAGTPWGP